METGKIPKWQEQVEGILREQFQGDELTERLKRAYELIGLVADIPPPCDDYREITALMMKLASEELPPLAATYTGFMLGVAWEKLRNADRTRKP